MTINGVISRFATGTYTVTRQEQGALVDGVLEPSVTTSTFQMVASIQPANGKDLESLPESDRTSDVKLVFSEVPLLTRRPGFEPDSVNYKGESWTVIKSEEWEHWGTTHYRAWMSRDEVT